MFKTLTNQIAFSNFMKYLFVKNVITQSLRLKLIETWDYTHFELIETLDFVNNKCSTLMKNFLFLNERILDENDENRTQRHIRVDKKHRSTQLSCFEFIAKFNSFRMKTRVNFMKLFSQYSFFQKIMQTYLRDYEIRMLNFDFKSLK